MKRVAVRAALLAPPVLFVGLLFVYPLVRILDVGLRPGGRLDLSVLGDVLGDAGLRGVVWFTLWQAVVSTVLTLAVGLPAAYLLSRFEFRGRRALAALVFVPFVLPTVVVGAAFAGAGRSLAALFAAHVFFNVAVVTGVVGGFWSHVDPAIEDAAEELGARGFRRFTAVLLPLARPAIVGAATLVFLFTFTSFGVVLLLGGPGRATIEV
ncbi:MAG: ABC transporter permease subunit, partial [Actinobacteria bacterium]|nr:ABC transporter permease subunit [Actinomycetota bacterium]